MVQPERGAGEAWGGFGEEGARELQALFAAIHERGTLPQDASAMQAASAVLCTLARRLGARAMHALEQALPPSVAPLVGRCLTGVGEEPELFGRQVFLQRVAEQLPTAPPDVRALVQAVCGALRAQLPAREAGRVARALPADLLDLWR